jgi:hypothetical protein
LLQRENGESSVKVEQGSLRWNHMHSQTGITAYRLSPVAQVLVVCVVVDVLMIPLGLLLGLALSLLIGDHVSRDILGLVVTGFFGAQLSMVVIWLCLMATSLYWCLVSVAVLVVLLLSLVPSNGSAPMINVLAAWAFMSTLPLAAMNVAGFRLAPYEDAGMALEQPMRFSLASLFVWTFVVAVVLALFQWLPAGIMRRFITLLAPSAVAVSTLWAVLRPGPIWLRLACAPTAVLLLSIYGAQQMLGWSYTAALRLLVSGLVYIVALAGLLVIYRQAGMRLVHKSAGGWLVR